MENHRLNAKNVVLFSTVLLLLAVASCVTATSTKEEDKNVVYYCSDNQPKEQCEKIQIR